MMDVQCRHQPSKLPGYTASCKTPFPASSNKLFTRFLHRNDPIIETIPLSAKNQLPPWMPGTSSIPNNPFIRINDNSDYSPLHFSVDELSHYNTVAASQGWPMYQRQNYSVAGPLAVPQNTGFPRNRGHARQASDSTIASTGPDSPYTQTPSYPYIANTDRSPTSATYLSEDATGAYAKLDAFNPFSVGYVPSQLSHTPAAHLAMKDMAIDHHNAADDSESSHGRNSPSTPRNANGDESDDRLYKVSSNEYPRPRVELYRTESAACQDELYNPANFMPSSSPQTTQQPTAQSNLLSPHRNLVSERLRTANSVRSHSPALPTSRDRSPFRQGSPLAPADGFRSPAPVIGTAAASRQHQKEQADAMEYAQHQPRLRREPTKTISPKDALLDYNESEPDANMPLFNDTIPMGYQKHYGGSEVYPSNFISGTNQAFGQFATTSQPNVTSFRASSSDGNSGGNTNYDFLPPGISGQISSANFAPQAPQTQQFRTVNSNISGPEQTPEFPAHLTSMESSMSESGAMPSSQESNVQSVIQRPANTSAATGSYTCTYQSCSLRFDTPVKLQKHKREAHQQARDHIVLSSAASSTSPVSSESPDREEAGMTSSALMARNSQAGPHKCSRINPSTGKPCNTIFSRPYDLTRHEDTIHNRTKQKVKCQYCRNDEKTFSRNDALTRHMRVVHPEVDFQVKRGRRGDY